MTQSLDSGNASLQSDRLMQHSASIAWAKPLLQNAAGQGQSRRRSDGGNSLKAASSARPFLAGFSPPPSPVLRDATGRRDPDYYRLFDKKSSKTFQQEGLVIILNFLNTSAVNLSFDLLSQSGTVLKSRTIEPQKTFVSALPQKAFYIRVRTDAKGQNAYEIALPIANS
jgi:hypothetical protein